MTRCLLLLLSCSVLALSASVQAPVAGAARYPDGSVYPLLGLSRAFVAGQPLANNVSAAAFSDKAGILAIENGLEIIDFSGRVLSRLDGDSRESVVAIQDAPLSAIAWMPASNSIATFSGNEWRTTVLLNPLPGTVVSIRTASKDTAHLLLSEGAQIFESTVGLASGDVLLQRLIPEAKAPATYLGDGLLYQDGDSLVFASSSSAKKTVRIHGPVVAFEPMSAQGMHVTESTSDAHWMLEITRGNGLAWSQLPVPALSLAGGKR